MGSHLRWFLVVIALSLFSLWVALPDTKISNMPDSCYLNPADIPAQGLHLDLNGDCQEELRLGVRQSLGLDLVGGLRVLLQAELPPGSYTADDLREAANNVARRVNALGVNEPAIQVQGSNRILVELPGISDPQQAIDTIRQTALLEFVNFSGLTGAEVLDLEGKKILTTEQLRIQEARRLEGDAATTDEGPAPLVNPRTGLPFETVMTGAGLQAASAALEPSGRWVIVFETTSDGAQIFGDYTQANVGSPMAIVLDGVVLSAPNIQSRIDTNGQITGNFDQESAQQLALQLRSGALPIPLRVESSERVGATLGQESVNLSIRAGIIGVIVVLAFMLIYYRVPGIAADLALLVFVLLNLAAFKLIPVTLTLPAITGFLISIGTAVDGNILIFERIKEELRAGRDVENALNAGFDRAWQSIRDSNISTIIICFVLFLFGQTPGASIVSGFAITLALGLVLNLFTAVLVTRTFLHVLIKLFDKPVHERQWLLGV
ncbi:MAG: protein translocase subunit SecD [Anaerolineae bacterium]|nr:protein translocase subunit SecD [Anaerolineae bacterium]